MIEKMVQVQTNISEELFQKLKIKCAKNHLFPASVLYALIDSLTKNISLDDIPLNEKN